MTKRELFFIFMFVGAVALIFGFFELAGRTAFRMLVDGSC